jgi:cytidylate kinase
MMRSPTSPSLDQLVERQVQRWALEEARRNAPPAPCVALSRLPGSGGAELGLRIADALGFGFFGIEIVDQIARERHVQRSLVAGLDEHLRDGLERWVGDTFTTRDFTESEYLQGLLRTLATLSERGCSVILGRGSAYAMPPTRTLRVLVVAPFGARAERLARARSLSLEAAELRTRHEDQERRRFIGHHFNLDPDGPLLYDVVVNTDTLGLDCAAELVLHAFSERFPGASVRRSAPAERFTRPATQWGRAAGAA